MKRLSSLLLVSSVALMPATSFAAQGTAAAAKPAAKATPAKAAAGAARTIEITASDPSAPSAKYGYSVTTIDAKPGEHLHIVLKALGTMPKMASSHNFIVFKPGTKEADITEFLQESPMAAATNYVPAEQEGHGACQHADGDRWRRRSRSDVHGADRAGTYTYLCSFPGHAAAGMKGKLVVK